MANFLAAIPWWVSVAMLLAGAVLLAYGNRHNHAGVRSAGLAITSLAVLLGVAPYLIDTDAERAERRTRQIVDSADKKDWPRLQSLLDADTHVEFGDKWPDATGAASVSQCAQALAAKVGLESIYLISVKTTQTPDLIAVTFSAATVQEVTQDRYYPSGWEFDFRPEGKKWDLQEIKLLRLGDQATQ